MSFTPVKPSHSPATNAYTLMTPGPVPVPPEVLEVLAQPMEHHRTPEFVARFQRVLTGLKKIFLTDQPVFILTATGTGGMEAAIVNTISPGDRVLAIVSGKFGERWAEIAEAYGALVTRINVPWGHAVKVKDVEDALNAHPDTVAVITQACETSTGVLHPVREIANLTSGRKTITMVDAITALGALPLPMDEWGVDVMIGGSQKAFMLPTGLAFIAFSEKAWNLAQSARTPRFYFDLRKEKAANEAGESGWSTSVTHIRALELVLNIFLSQGLDRVQGRIQTLSRATIAAVQEMGLTIFPETPSPSLSAVCMPDGIDGQKIRAEMEKNSLVVVMGGQDKLKGRIIRIGHMGAIRDKDLLKTLSALAQSLNSAKPGLIPIEKQASALHLATEILKESPAVVMQL
jgi:aspartate aminotransferase-like enzyme